MRRARSRRGEPSRRAGAARGRLPSPAARVPGLPPSVDDVSERRKSERDSLRRTRQYFRNELTSLCYWSDA